MLRSNIDVTVGLVNGAIGTVMGIYATRISIKFDHIDVPCDIERVTSRFMLSKNLYIHRKQFPLILSYAITIHKCQGLSLDTAIIDLSADVFGDVSNLFINEINRLRSKFRKDLPQIKKSKGKKRKIQVTGIIDDGEPCNLKTKFNVKDDDSCSSLTVSIKLSKIKCKPKDDKTKCVVKNDHCSSNLIVSIKLSSINLKKSNPKKDDDVIFTYEEPPNPGDNCDYVYYPANEEVQRCCEILNLKFVTAARILPGSPTTPLSDERVPNSTLDVPGDGNCLFYALSYLITGSIS
uniref:OTU domain-containing protein n=1 Tax=Amphimedon queenslandica TaxID=400682 RepID=A0A1X7TFB4_AMPQE